MNMLHLNMKVGILKIFRLDVRLCCRRYISNLMEINDVVHGKIMLHDYIELITKTRPFQRLKNVKQLGPFYLLHPEGSHKRYEHCIGTFKAAQQLCEYLERNTWHGEKHIPKFYKLAVEIAALLHDLGHGPFSHTWEYVNKEFHHEKNAFNCIDKIFDEVSNSVLNVLHENDKYGIELIKALIIGDSNYLKKPIPKEFHFIFDIVHNERCGVDVDKWDYLRRDHYYLKDMCNPNMQFDDIFKYARISADGHCIEYRYEDYDKIYLLYQARYMLYKECYRQPILLVYNELLRRIVHRSKSTINGLKLYKINADIDYDAFCQLHDDNLLSRIEDDEEYKYIKDFKSIVKVDNQWNDELLPQNILIVNDEIPGPGTTMPNDDKFYFYGDPCKKRPIKRNTTGTKNLVYYQLL